jgi:hypothetical protein
MKSKILMGGAVLLATLTASAATLAVQDKPKPISASAGDDPMMAKWMEYATPGEAHKALEPNIGKWTLKVKHAMQPGDPLGEASDATSEVVWIMDGRYTQEEVTGSFMDQPFKGMGLMGYDNFKKKYVSTWCDNMGTGIMTAEGTYDAASKTFTYTGECPDMMTGKLTKSRSTQKWTDKDHWTMQAFKAGPDGKEALIMEIVGTRAK